MDNLLKAISIIFVSGSGAAFWAGLSLAMGGPFDLVFIVFSSGAAFLLAMATDWRSQQ